MGVKWLFFYNVEKNQGQELKYVLVHILSKYYQYFVTFFLWDEILPVQKVL